MDNLDSELKAYYFFSIKKTIKKEYVEYLEKNPELLQNFQSSLLLDKPDDICKYVQEYFSLFNKQKEIIANKQKEIIANKPLVIVGPSGVGKVLQKSFFIVLIYLGSFSQMATH